MSQSPRIIAGFGFSTRATTASLLDALGAVREAHPVNAVATLADKARALSELAQTLGVEIIAVTGELPATPTQSPVSLAARETGSVAEACALAAAGPGGYLLATRAISADGLATCALAACAKDLGDDE